MQGAGAYAPNLTLIRIRASLLAQEIQLGLIKQLKVPIVVLRMTLPGGRAWQGDRAGGSPCRPKKPHVLLGGLSTCGTGPDPLSMEGSGPGMLGFGVQNKATPRPGAGTTLPT